MVKNLSTLQQPLRDSPCILVLGSEERGLFRDIKARVDQFVIIEGRRTDVAGVDSLNVSVAAGLLCEGFLRNTKPSYVPKQAERDQSQEVDRLF